MSFWASITSLISTQPDQNALRAAQSAFEHEDKRTAFQSFKTVEKDFKSEVFENIWKLKGKPCGYDRYGESKFYGLRGRVDCELNAKAIKMTLYPALESEFCTPSHMFSYGNNCSSHTPSNESVLAFGATIDISIEPYMESQKHEYERDQQIDRENLDRNDSGKGTGENGGYGFEGMVCNDYSLHDISSYT